jgi:hypothetical protein
MAAEENGPGLIPRLDADFRCAMALHRSGVLDDRRLPEVATSLLTRGDERPRLVDLASLDMTPFFSIDAAELFEEIVERCGEPTMSDTEALIVTLGILARLHLNGEIPVERMLPRLGSSPKV